ncbi:helix-turn-helix domain-containing protein [Aliiglaciecola sp. CAU 1673]|uniref:helix-turn-helix domain-containing protein n=1 Tax=Aliiglaciecola sp. CAU 1673 TaxID=3032595 RepID=UPI0023DC56C2|nr:helix-turn-helix domain-containing protein [Aliiglaciecola sp. CAU 1673]MDF2177941.1 helix-turn-helix domain-containing protein [Aliiglaciecola sp. CAU 1673]
MNITRPDQLGNAIRVHRKKIGVTQKQVSERVSMRIATVSDFENNTESSKLETLFKILAALDLQLEVKRRGDSRDQAWDESW